MPKAKAHFLAGKANRDINNKVQYSGVYQLVGRSLLPERKVLA